MATTEIAPKDRGAEALLPAPRIRLDRAAKVGLVGGVTASFLAIIGMIEQFAARDIIGGLSLGYILLLLVLTAFGYIAGRPPPQLEGYEAPRTGARNVAAGVIAGVLTGAVTAAVISIVGNLDIRSTFPNISPDMISLMTLERGLPLGSLILVVGGAALGTIGGAYHLLSVRLRKAITAALIWVVLFGLLESIVIQILSGSRSLGIDLLIGVFGDPPASPVLIRVLYQPDGALRVLSAVVIGLVVFGVAYWLGGRAKRPRFADRFARMERGKRTRTILILAVVFLVLGALGPPILGRFMSQVLDVAGIYLVMALGLNIVVGYAGLLDLGYVAFFAVGAYTTAILTSPTSPAFSPELNWWLAIPFVMMAAALAGLIVGTPVLRMRGDYLAIVTLGFGEIVRILFLSDWLKPVFGGAQGIRNIPAIPPQSLDLNNPQWFLYIVIIFAVVAAYVSWALQDSRIGRAWMAMREDESVAEVMGVDTVVAKLSAFIIGAIFASLGGALFAAKVHSVFPNLFEIIVSIQILIIVIVGGMGSIRGVMVGALLIVALPELLREFEFYRFLLYGALLIYMMLARPEGLIPSRRRAAELHEDERSQDVWLKKEEAPQPGRGEA